MPTKRELENEVLKNDTLEAGRKIFANKYVETIVFGMVGVILLAFATVVVNSYIHPQESATPIAQPNAPKTP